MVHQIKMYDRFKDFLSSDVIRYRIAKMFAYIGVSETDIQFLDVDDSFGNPGETCQYIAYRTYSNSIDQKDIDAVFRLMLEEKNQDHVIRTIVVDFSNGSIRGCALEEYPDK